MTEIMCQILFQTKELTLTFYESRTIWLILLTWCRTKYTHPTTDTTKQNHESLNSLTTVIIIFITESTNATNGYTYSHWDLANPSTERLDAHFERYFKWSTMINFNAIILCKALWWHMLCVCYWWFTCFQSCMFSRGKILQMFGTSANTNCANRTTRYWKSPVCRVSGASFPDVPFLYQSRNCFNIWLLTWIS